MPEKLCLIHMAELPGCLMKDDSVYLNQIIHRYLCTCHIDLVQRAKSLGTSALQIFLRFFPPLFFFRWFVTCALLASEITLAALIDVTSICRTNSKKPLSKTHKASGTHKTAAHHASLSTLLSLILIQVLVQWAIPCGQLAALVLLRLCHTSHQLAGVDMFSDLTDKQQKIVLYRRLLGKVTCDGDGGADGKENIKKNEWLVDHAIDGAIRVGDTCPPMKLVFQMFGVRQGMNLAREITSRYWSNAQTNKHKIREPDDDVPCDVSGQVPAAGHEDSMMCSKDSSQDSLQDTTMETRDMSGEDSSADADCSPTNKVSDFKTSGNNIVDKQVDSGDHTETEGDHTGTEGDHTGTEGDHTETEGDRTGVEGDHTETEGDHTETEGDHTGVEGDKKSTEGDHLLSEGKHPESKNDQHVSEGDHTMSKNEHNMFKDDHIMSKDDHIMSKDDQPESEGDRKHVTLEVASPTPSHPPASPTADTGRDLDTVLSGELQSPNSPLSLSESSSDTSDATQQDCSDFLSVEDSTSEEQF